MKNNDINALLQEIRQDSYALDLAAQNYKKKVTSTLTSPITIAAVFVGGLLVARSIFAKKRVQAPVYTKMPAPGIKGAITSHMPAMVGTLVSAVAPKLLWDIYRSVVK